MPLPRPLTEGGRGQLALDLTDLGPTKTVLRADGAGIDYIEVVIGGVVYRRTYSYPDDLTIMATDWSVQ